LAGEGLQHQDGHTHLLAYSYPHVQAYDPAFPYEIAVLLEEGIKQMYVEEKKVIFYITVGNENVEQPAAPLPIKELRPKILKGMYRFRESQKKGVGRVELLGSGALVSEALKAAGILEETYDVAANVWSVTSYKTLYQDALNKERESTLGSADGTGEQSRSYFAECLEGEGDAVVAVSDYLKALPFSLARWVKQPFTALGTDGFGRSEGRSELRDYFEVDARYIVIAALSGLVKAGKLDAKVLAKAREEHGINPDKVNPMLSHWALGGEAGEKVQQSGTAS